MFERLRCGHVCSASSATTSHRSMPVWRSSSRAPSSYQASPLSSTRCHAPKSSLPCFSSFSTRAWRTTTYRLSKSHFRCRSVYYHHKRWSVSSRSAAWFMCTNSPVVKVYRSHLIKCPNWFYTSKNNIKLTIFIDITRFFKPKFIQYSILLWAFFFIIKPFLLWVVDKGKGENVRGQLNLSQTIIKKREFSALSKKLLKYLFWNSGKTVYNLLT